MMHDPEPSSLPESSGSSVFPTTQWSMVLHAGAGADTQARSAMEALCRQYWYPLYSFIRRHGHAHHEAEDCTQEFLARLLAAEGIARARPERGRFRTFLLTALRNFLTDEWRRSQAVKHGAGQVPWSLEFEIAEARYAREPVDPALTPEQVFDHHWATGLLQRAKAELREEYEKSGRGDLFTALAPIVWENARSASHAELADRMGMTADACSVAIHRLRRRLGERLRLDVAQTVADESEVDSELRHLISAIQ